jgi:hypothetical protein
MMSGGLKTQTVSNKADAKLADPSAAWDLLAGVAMCNLYFIEGSDV